MTSRIKNLGLRMRTAYCLDGLRKRTSLGAGRIERRVRENQYEALGLSALSPTTVQEYFLLRRCPAVDGAQGQPCWLFAAELEFGGVAYSFFHPIFDLLIEPVQSSPRWIVRMERIPRVWIEQAVARGDEVQAQEWEAFNATLEPRRGRPPRQFSLDPLTLVHLSMLRLPKDYSGWLFERSGLATTHARTYGPVDEEVARLVRQSGVDALAALIGLVQEAAQIGDRRRLSTARKGVEEHLRAHGLDPSLDRVQEPFLYLVESQIRPNIEVRRYSAAEIFGSGFPVTWQAKIHQSICEYDFGKSVARTRKTRVEE